MNVKQYTVTLTEQDRNVIIQALNTAPLQGLQAAKNALSVAQKIAEAEEVKEAKKAKGK